MKYKGIELKEITEPGNIVFPKKMVVWDNIGLGSNEPCVRKVNALVKDNIGITRVIASQLDKNDAGVAIWNHCAEIPEEPKPRRATNRELAKWIASGNGEIKDIIDVAITFCSYPNGLENTEVRNGIKVRKWEDTDWHEPDVQYMGLEDNENG